MEEDATNADATTVVDDNKPVTEEDLRALKYGADGVEVSEETDEPTTTEETEEESTESEEEQSTEDAPSFVKEFPQIKGDTPEEYAKNLEEAYRNSSSEALRLKGLAEAPKIIETEETTEDLSTTSQTPLELWAGQQLDKSIKDAFSTFSKEYTQVEDPVEYERFTKRVATLSKTILQDEGRLAEPSDLYSTAAASLGWEKVTAPTSKEKLDMALKDTSSTSKPSTSGAKPPAKSKVSDAMMRMNRNMYPGKTDEQIRKELEPYV